MNVLEHVLPHVLIRLPRYVIAACVVLIVPSIAFAQQPLQPPQSVRAVDTPSDAGGAITLVWSASSYDGPGVRYEIRMANGESNGTAGSNGAKVIADFPSDTHYMRDAKLPWWTRPVDQHDHYYVLRSGKGIELKNGTTYLFTVSAVRGEQRADAPIVHAVPEPNWVNWNSMNNLLVVLLFGGVVVGSIYAARRHEIFLRRIPGLDAVDEAIGRATELGKPILFLTGAGDMSEPSTLAAAVILGRVAKRVASYETDLLVPHRDPIVMAVCQEITKQAYLEAGKPDVFKEDSNFFITTDQFSYTASVDGLMLRKQPAANFFMGSYFAEALLLTETGASTGAIQIAGTDSDHQLPFFVTTCDYTLIGEELYAASAYLSREPVQVGTLRGQDIGKGIVLGMIVTGTLLATAGVMLGVEWPAFVLDLLKDLK
ncbi:MAG TPA: fibronectin type III domain-containing protein [Nitrospiraceae bacterium]|nr:fibronectin type III domain-containing protein [Nitrospiraceae bacterium]